jgi:hypothetical protein
VDGFFREKVSIFTFTPLVPTKKTVSDGELKGRDVQAVRAVFGYIDKNSMKF